MISLIKILGKEKNCELTQYISDVNRIYAEGLVPRRESERNEYKDNPAYCGGCHIAGDYNAEKEVL